MKARFVLENMDFERSRDPRKTLGIGKIHLEQFKDVIITALEGGSNYWYMIDGRDYRDNLPPKSPEMQSMSERIAYALYTDPNFILPVYDAETADSKNPDLLGKVTQASMFKAFQIAEEDYPNAYENIMNEEYDADDADIIFQIATMGELTFG